MLYSLLASSTKYENAYLTNVAAWHRVPQAYELGWGALRELQPPKSGKEIFFGQSLNFSGRKQQPKILKYFFSIF